MTHPKPWLTPGQQVAQLKARGVRFEIWDEASARDYLARHNNYFRLRSYRKSFPKIEGGAHDGEYDHLDFAMLVDLSRIDMRLRDAMLPVALDIEHFEKLALLSSMEAHGEDGYAIVRDYAGECVYRRPDGTEGSHLMDEVARGGSSPYVGGLVASRPDGDYAAWELLELISFGQLIHLARFCGERYSDSGLLNDFYILQKVKELRNACAHGSCVLNGMRDRSARFRPNAEVQEAMKAIGIGKAARRSEARNAQLQDIAATLYMHQRIASAGTAALRGQSLRGLECRFKKHAGWYGSDNPITSGLGLISRMVDGWYPAP